MTLDWLKAVRFRNLLDVRLGLAPGINLVTGDNGSGKTSLLECCYFLSAARSFRGTTLDPVITRGEEDCLIRGGLTRAGTRYDIGISRHRNGERRIRINGEDVSRSSDLARLLPVLTLGPASVDLLLGPPDGRRRFLNWGLFHVEPAFSHAWTEANRCLQQRNQLLRENLPVGTRHSGLQTWTEQLARSAERLHTMRVAFVERYIPAFGAVLTRLAGGGDYELRYNAGWDTARPLQEIYLEDLENDQKRGFTQRGFQRADVRITVGGQPADQVCSRGELKALAWSLILAQGMLVDEWTTPVGTREDTRGKHGAATSGTLYLVDDVASEFDREHRARVCRFLRESGHQVLLTGIDGASLADACEGEYSRMFHVKQGQVEVEETR